MPQLDREAISRRVAQARKETGLTQAELADAVGVHARSVQNWESPAHSELPFAYLEPLTTITGVSVEWLFHGGLTSLQPEDAASLVEALDEIRSALQRIEARLDDLAGPQSHAQTP